MKNTIFAALFALVATVANANTLTLNYVMDTTPESQTLSVYALVEGGNDGLLNYDLAINGIDSVAGLQSDGIDFTPVVLTNLNTSFQPTGFPTANDLDGPSGSDAWSAGGSQFGAANPLIGLGKQDVFVEGAAAVPNNPNVDVPFTPLGSLIGSVDLGVALDQDTLERILGGGGTVFSGDTGSPIALDGPATINVIGIPEPTTALLAGLALVGFVARRK